MTPTIGALLGFTTEFADGNVMTEILAECQADIGFSGPGDAVLSVCGDDLSAGTVATMRLVGAPVSSMAYGVATFTLDPVAIYGGTVIDATPDLLMAFPTNPGGTVIVPNLPGGIGVASLYVQMAFVAPASVPVAPYLGFSNAVRIDFQ